jgi:hypothetical protein
MSRSFVNKDKNVSLVVHNSNLDIYDNPEVHRKTSIICTIGPKTKSVDMLTRLREAGMNVVRMNFSHGSYEYHGEVIANTRESVKLHPLHGRPVAIALDTKGPEIRTGLLKGDQNATVMLEMDKELTITTDDKYKEVRRGSSSCRCCSCRCYFSCRCSSSRCALSALAWGLVEAVLRVAPDARAVVRPGCARGAWAESCRRGGCLRGEEEAGS